MNEAAITPVAIDGDATLPDRETMYEALVRKDTRFEGVFVAAIRTTGIFCRPTCTARKPKPENVVYYSCARVAISNGFRACKVCRPLLALGATPKWIEPLLDEVAEDPTIRLRASDLRGRGLDPARVRRWFQKNHGMTFTAYLRMRRINQAFAQIQQQRPVTAVALESGYRSVSGFGDGFKKAVGTAPANSRNQRSIAITRLPTPLGPMLAGATESGICLLEFTDRPMLETQLSRVRKRLGATTLPGASPFFDELNEQLTSYFAGNLEQFDVPLVPIGTPFQERVWSALRDIPHGQTRSYGEQAKAIGQPTATRAVARANGDNRISILIPCHRVIGADGTLTGYGGGLWRKRRLLEIENVQFRG